MTQKKKSTIKKEKKSDLISKELTIGEVVAKYPETAEILMAEGVHCVGCGAANHESIEEGLASHGISQKEIELIVKKMNNAIDTTQADPESVVLSGRAVKKLNEIMKEEKKENNSLRIKVHSGGCSGFQYELDFEKKESKDDIIISSEGIKLLVDPESFKMLKGSVIDFIESQHAAGFNIKNPNTPKSSCEDSGCGSGCGC